MARGVCLVEQAPQLKHIELASSRGEGWILFAQVVKPAEQMGIAAQLGEGDQVREIGLNITEKAPSGDSIALYRLRSQGSSESLNAALKDLREDRVGLKTWSGGAADLWLERPISLGRGGARREILGEDEPGRHGVALAGKVTQ